MIRYFEKLYSGGFDSFCALLRERMVKGEKTFVVTANPETVMRAEEDGELQTLLLDPATLAVPDGIGIVKAASMVGLPVKERIAGIDLAQTLIEAAAEEGKTVCLFGAAPEVLEALCEKLALQYPSLRIGGAFHGYLEDKDGVMEQIAALKPDLLLVALGIPLQETLIYRHLHRFEKGIFIGVGGSFDVMSGRKKRAPKWMIRCHLEWLYRLLKEPSRIRRFYQSNVKFFFRLKRSNKGNV